MDFYKLFEKQSKKKLKTAEKKLNNKYKFFKELKTQNEVLNTYTENINNRILNTKINNNEENINEIDKILNKVKKCKTKKINYENFQNKISLLPFMIHHSYYKNVFSNNNNYVNQLKRGINKKDIEYIEEELESNNKNFSGNDKTKNINIIKDNENKFNKFIDYDKEFENIYENYFIYNPQRNKEKNNTKLTNAYKKLKLINRFRKTNKSGRKTVTINNEDQDTEPKERRKTNKNKKTEESEEEVVIRDKKTKFLRIKKKLKIILMFLAHILTVYQKKLVNEFSENIFIFSDSIQYSILNRN